MNIQRFQKTCINNTLVSQLTGNAELTDYIKTLNVLLLYPLSKLCPKLIL